MYRMTWPARAFGAGAAGLYARATAAGVRWNLRGGPVKVAARAGLMGPIAADMAGGHYLGPKNLANMTIGYARNLTRATLAVTAFTQGLRASSSALMAFQQRYVEFNGTMAVAFSRYQAAEIRRDISMGRMIGPSYAGLSQARSRLEVQVQPYSAAVTILNNRLMQLMLNINSWAIKIGEWLSPINEIRDWIIRRFGGGPAARQPLEQIMTDIANGALRGGRGLGAAANPPPPVGPPRP
jgi:hypothetical protein